MTCFKVQPIQKHQLFRGRRGQEDIVSANTVGQTIDSEIQGRDLIMDIRFLGEMCYNL